VLILFVASALTAGCGLVTGTSVLGWLDAGRVIDRSGDRAMVATWLGLLVLVNLLLVLSLFAPLSPSVTAAAVLLLLGAALARQETRTELGHVCRQVSAANLIGVLTVMLGAAAYCSQVIVWYDSGLYHVQVVKWLTEQGLVPGLALIHSRFGFISSWFTLPALFNHGFLAGRVMALPGALCLALVTVHALVAWMRICGGETRRPDWFLGAALLLTIPVVLLHGIPNAPTPDFPVIVLVLVVAWVILVVAGGEGQVTGLAGEGRSRLVPLLLAVGAVSIKLSALPLLVIAGCFSLFGSPSTLRKSLLVVGGTAGLGLLPTAAAGIVVAGCAFYPVALSCVDLPWSLGAEAVAREVSLVRDFARWGSLAPEGASPLGWLSSWWRFEWVAAGLLLLSVLAALWLAASRACKSYAERWVAVLGVVGIVYMLAAAPTWRFGLGYLVLLSALALTCSIGVFSALPARLRWLRPLRNFAFAGAVVGLFIVLHAHLVPRPSYRLLDEAIAAGTIVSDDHPHFNLLLPPRTWNIAYDLDKATGRTVANRNVIVEDTVGDVHYSRTADADKSDLCWDAPLPCAWQRLEEIRLRDFAKGLAGGFENVSARPDTAGGM